MNGILFSGTEKVVMRADGDKADNVGAFVIKNGAIIPGYVNASTASIGIVQKMIV